METTKYRFPFYTNTAWNMYSDTVIISFYYERRELSFKKARPCPVKKDACRKLRCSLRRASSFFLQLTGRSVCYIRNQRKLSCSLHSNRQLSLMLCTRSGDPARQNLSTLGNILAQQIHILVINDLILVCTEDTNLSSSVHRSSSHGGSAL